MHMTGSRRRFAIARHHEWSLISYNNSKNVETLSDFRRKSDDSPLSLNAFLIPVLSEALPDPLTLIEGGGEQLLARASLFC